MVLMKKHLQEVSNRIKVTGNTVPDVRRAFRKPYSFSHLPFKEQLVVWEYIWKNASDWRVKTQPFFFCEKYAVKEVNAAHAWNTLKYWQDQVSDWAFCDSLSKIFTKHLELFPKEVYDQLKKWNKHQDPWKRRQSVVSLLYYTRTKKRILPFKSILPLVANLLHDKEYYVQKGVGWSLRELYNAYPEETYAYLLKNIENISGIAFSAATEKLDPKQKQALKAKRI